MAENGPKEFSRGEDGPITIISYLLPERDVNSELGYDITLFPCRSHSFPAPLISSSPGSPIEVSNELSNSLTSDKQVVGLNPRFSLLLKQ